MKKVFLIFGIIGAVLVLLLCAFVACDESVLPSASAEEVVPSALSTKIVKPNLLPFYDFSGTTQTPSNINTADVGIYTSFTDPNAVFINDNTSLYYSAPSSSSKYIYFLFDTPGDGYTCYLRVLGGVWGSIPVSCSYQILDLTTGVQLNTGSATFQVEDSSTGPITFTISPADKSTSHRIRISLLPNASTSNTLRFYYVKLESAKTPSSRGVASTVSFTGFIVPDYSYTLSANPVDPSDPSPYDSWNGIVNPNLIDNADFWEFPLYTNVAQPNNLVAPYYYTDIPSSDFSFGGNMDFSTYKLPTVTFSTYEGANGVVANSRHIKYRYFWEDIYADIAFPGFRYPLTYTFSGALFNQVRITLSDDLNHSVSELFTYDASDFIYSLVYSPQGAQYNYLDIDLEFIASDVNSPVAGSLYWSKLEVGTFLTGYVPVTHDQADISNQNYINNYDFSKLYSYATGSNVWIRTSGMATIDLQQDGKGWDIYYTNNDFTLSYNILASEIPSGTSCLFTLMARTSSSPFTLAIYDGSTLLKTSYITPSVGSYVRSIFVPYSRDLIINLVFPSSGESGHYYLDYAKFEIGDSFTGFSPSVSGFFEDGVNSVIDYNNGESVVGAYYYFPSNDYGAFSGSLTDSTTSFDPYFVYRAPSSSTWSSTYGLGIVTINSDSPASLSTSTFHWNANTQSSAKYVFAFQLYSVNAVDVSFLFDTDSYSRTIEGNTLVWYALDAEPSSLTISLLSSSSTLFLTSYKTEKSPFFTGFPNDALDYNGNAVSVYNLGYNAGYDSGFYSGLGQIESSNYKTGYDTGYDVGFTSGKSIGHSLGYNEGLSLAGNASWKSLVSALIDVPVTTIVSFLDFEILGFNMLNILRTVILLSLFFFLLNKLTGK